MNMPSSDISQLQELQKQSRKRLSSVAVAAIQSNSKPRTLVKSTLVANGLFSLSPIKGAKSLQNLNNKTARRKVKTFSPGSEHIMSILNKELLGGDSYPILTAALGIATGAVSAGAGLFFTVATTGITLAKTANKALARQGDEIWHIEEIGKSGNKAIYISSYILVDPYRKQSIEKGWLIHEEREELTLT